MRNFSSSRKGKPRTIVKEMCIFVASFVLLFLVLNWGYVNFLDDRKIINRQLDGWEKHKNALMYGTVPYAFFGDSHPTESINPQYIENSFNFGTYGQDYIETYFILKNLVEKEGIIIENAVLQVDLHTFSYTNVIRSNASLFQELTYYAKFVSLENISHFTGRNIASLCFQKKFPIIGRGEEIVEVLISPMKELPIEKGWVNRSLKDSPFDMKEGVKRKYRQHFNDPLELRNGRTFEYFLKTIDFAHKNNIKIVFITYPLPKAFDDEIILHILEIQKFYNDTFAEVNKITKEYFILDYYGIFFDKVGYFADSDHLNVAGSTNFSKRVGTDLETLS